MDLLDLLVGHPEEEDVEVEMVVEGEEDPTEDTINTQEGEVNGLGEVEEAKVIMEPTKVGMRVEGEEVTRMNMIKETTTKEIINRITVVAEEALDPVFKAGGQTTETNSQ